MMTEKHIERAAMLSLPRWPTKRCSSVLIKVPFSDTAMSSIVNQSCRRASGDMPHTSASLARTCSADSSARESAACRALECSSLPPRALPVRNSARRRSARALSSMWPSPAAPYRSSPIV